MASDPRDNLPKWLQFCLVGLILYSTVMVALETVPDLSDYWPLFHISEVVVVILFTIEYVTCWFLSENRRRYPLRPMNIIDLLAILPFYLSLGTSFAVLRSLRLLRHVAFAETGTVQPCHPNVGRGLSPGGTGTSNDRPGGHRRHLHRCVRAIFRGT